MCSLRFSLLGLLLIFNFPSFATSEKINLQLKWLNSFQFAGYYAAKEKGFYAEENLDVELLERKMGVNNIQQVINGESEYGVADTALLVERLNGIPVVVLASIFQHSPLVYVSLKSSGIVSPHDIRGKRIMDDDYDNAPLQTLLYEAGIKGNEVTHIPNTANIDDLIQGNTDVVLAYSTDEIDHYQQRGVEINVINPRNYGIDFLGDNLFTTQTEIDKHPERVKKFLRASLKGWEYAAAHPDEMVDLIFEKYNTQPLTREHLKFEATETLKMIAPNNIPIGQSNLNRFERIAETYKELGLVKSTNNLNGFIYGKTNHWLSLKAKADLNWQRLIDFLIPITLFIFFGMYRNFQLRREISARQKLEFALQKSLDLFKSVIDNAPLIRVFWKDLNGNYLGCNLAFANDAGLKKAADILGKNDFELDWKTQAEKYRADDRRVMNTNKPKLNFEELMFSPNGDTITLRTSKVPLHDAEENVIGVLGIYEDITASKVHEQQLEHMAYHDILTGLPNRLLLADRMQISLAHARRDNSLVIVCYLDLDGFKTVNDQFGHKIGDFLLVEAANRMKKTLREEDTVARLGGDEFAFLLLGLKTKNEYETALLRFLAALNAPFQIENHAVSISASIGATIYPNDNSDADTLLRHADQAMYEAKQNHKNCFKIYNTEIAHEFQAHQDKLKEIENALFEDEFVLFFQPKVDMQKGEVIGAEALIRWNHPEHGLLMPNDFLDLIEHHPLAVQLDAWVMNNALKQMTKWHECGLMWTISVNLSAGSLQAHDFSLQLCELLADYPNVKPQHFELEILETEALQDLTKTSEMMKACQKLGVKFSLDDFGTGYSSLAYLRHLPANILKIDQSFVRDMLHDADDLAIVKGVIGLAASFKRYVIAEGVETIEHGTTLSKLKCRYAQGYAIAKPMPAVTFEIWAETWKSPEEWKITT